MATNTTEAGLESLIVAQMTAQPNAWRLRGEGYGEEEA